MNPVIGRRENHCLSKEIKGLIHSEKACISLVVLYRAWLPCLYNYNVYTCSNMHWSKISITHEWSSVVGRWVWRATAPQLTWYSYLKQFPSLAILGNMQNLISLNYYIFSYWGIFPLILGGNSSVIYPSTQMPHFFTPSPSLERRGKKIRLKWIEVVLFSFTYHST